MSEPKSTPENFGPSVLREAYWWLRVLTHLGPEKVIVDDKGMIYLKMDDAADEPLIVDAYHPLPAPAASATLRE